MTSELEAIARVLEPQAWAALGHADTLAYKNRRTSSLRKARAALMAIREPTEAMMFGGWGPTMADGENTPLAVWRAMIDHILGHSIVEDEG